MDDQIKELVKALKMPHRIANRGVLLAMCERAAQVIELQDEELEKAKAPATPAPKKAAKKADG